MFACVCGCMSGKTWLPLVRSESPVPGKMLAQTLKAQRNPVFPSFIPRLKCLQWISKPCHGTDYAGTAEHSQLPIIPPECHHEVKSSGNGEGRM